MSVLKNIASGAGWTASSQWTMQLLQFITSVVLARLLSPRDYGIVAMSAAFTGFIALFADLGFGPALVQRKHIDSRYIDVAFTTTTAAALILFVLCWFGAPLVARFYDEPMVNSIVKVAVIGLLMAPVNAVLLNLLVREMRFKEIAGIEVACSLSSQATALVAAFLGFGLWSLVMGSLVFQAIRMPLVIWRTRHFPRFSFNWEHFKDLFSFGGNLMGFSFLNYFARNLDNIIIGRFLGPVALGYYDLAYRIMLKPLYNVSYTLGQPLFSGLSALQEDKQQAGETYRKVVIAISLICFPMMLGLAAVAPEFMAIVFGEKWIPAVPVLQILCFVGAMQSVGTTVGAIYQSQGRTDVMLRVGIINVTVICVAFLIGVHWGIVGVALSYSIAAACIWFYSHHVANKLIKLSDVHFWRSLQPGAVMSGLMALIIFALRHILLFKFQINGLVFLIVLVVTGIILYGSFVLRSKHPVIVVIRNAIIQRLKMTFAL